jgi:hypothetical protein
MVAVGLTIFLLDIISVVGTKLTSAPPDQNG